MPEIEEKRTSIKENFFYGLGILGSSTIGFLVNNWLLYFYLPPDDDPLIPVALSGFVILAGRIIASLITPWIGYLSDNARFRWGRRLPFMFVAVIPLIVSFIFLWAPPFQSQPLWNYLYIFVIMIVYRIASVVYMIPYQALLPEIATQERHRVRISAWQSGFLLAGMLVGGLAGLLIDEIGYLLSALVYAGIALLFLFLPILVLKKRPQQRLDSNDKINFPESLLITLKNQAFVVFIIVWSLYLMTSTLSQSFAPFLVTEVCLLNQADTTSFYIPAILVSLVMYPLIVKFSSLIGKRKVYIISLLASAFVFPTTMLIGSWFPIPLKTQCISWAVLQAVALSGTVVLSSTFVAETIDYDETITGQRRGGVYFAMMKFLDQLLTGIASLLLPLFLLLGRSQNSQQGPLGVRMIGLVAGALMFIGFLIFLRYPSDLERADHIRIG